MINLLEAGFINNHIKLLDQRIINNICHYRYQLLTQTHVGENFHTTHAQ